MPVPSHLLERAYQLINANQLENAELVLDAVVRVDPQNVEAWKTYLKIYQSQNDLDWLKERVLKTRELSQADKTELINYHLQLTLRLNGAKEGLSPNESFALFPQEEQDEASAGEETNVRFELIDVFDYPTLIVKNEARTRRRRRAIYNPITFDLVRSALNAVSHHPFGRKIAIHIQKIILLGNDFIKNPKDNYIKFSQSLHFEKSTGMALLTLFALGVRLVVSDYFLGYLFLGIFMIGSGWWLFNFGSRGASRVRIYLHEHKNNLPVINDLEIDQEEELNEEDFENTPK